MPETLIIGAGQAGLAMAAALAAKNVTARLVDSRARVGGAWPDYYESLRLFSPVRYSALPGLIFPGSPEHYPSAAEVSAYLAAYARMTGPELVLSDRVEHVATAANEFEVRLDSSATIKARALVVATGTFGAPHIPSIKGSEKFTGRMLHANAYHRPDHFAGQRVIVVGAANSAVQIAHDLLPLARAVTLAVRKPVRFVPQRLLRRDIHFWFDALGVDRARWLSDQGTPVIDSGRYRAAIRSGAIAQRFMFTAFDEDGVIWPDGSRLQADAIIFATGYRPDVNFLHGLPVLDSRGRLDQRDGVARRVPGLFFIGQPGLRNFASGTLRGVARDAPIVAHKIGAYLASRRHEA